MSEPTTYWTGSATEHYDYLLATDPRKMMADCFAGNRKAGVEVDVCRPDNPSITGKVLVHVKTIELSHGGLAVDVYGLINPESLRCRRAVIRYYERHKIAYVRIYYLGAR